MRTIPPLANDVVDLNSVVCLQSAGSDVKDIDISADEEGSRGRRGGVRGNDLGRRSLCIRLARGLVGERGSVCDCGGVLLGLIGCFRRRILRLRRHRRRRGRVLCGRPWRFVTRGFGRFLRVSDEDLEKIYEANYFAMMLPGSATLTVHSLPFVGWNTAVGFEVSTTAGLLFVPLGAPFGIAFASDRRFRFCNP